MPLLSNSKAHKKCELKKKRFLCELSQHQGAVNLFYTLRGFLTATAAILISPLTEASVNSPDMM